MTLLIVYILDDTVKLHVHDPGAVGTILDQTIIGKCPAVTKPYV